jgi:hypothetical protein
MVPDLISIAQYDLFFVLMSAPSFSVSAPAPVRVATFSIFDRFYFHRHIPVQHQM